MKTAAFVLGVCLVGRMASARLPDERPVVWRIEPSDTAEIERAMGQTRPDGVVCANDFTAANLMKALNEIGVSVPGEVRLVGFDDVKYASLLPVPLTTIRQPCVELGAAAVFTMMARLRNPSHPPRDILLDFKLVVRQSCGSPGEFM